jgi:hypothetical protein
MKTLTLKIADRLLAEIASAARSRNLPKSEIIRERLTHKAATAKRARGSLWSHMDDLPRPALIALSANLHNRA